MKRDQITSNNLTVTVNFPFEFNTAELWICNSSFSDCNLLEEITRNITSEQDCPLINTTRYGAQDEEGKGLVHLVIFPPNSGSKVANDFYVTIDDGSDRHSVTTTSTGWTSDTGRWEFDGSEHTAKLVDKDGDCETRELEFKLPEEIGGLLEFPGTPSGIASRVVTFAIGIGGGIALLLIIFGGFRLAFSAGDPEAVMQGRQVITAAIVGLMVIIFSVFILRLIGIGILGIGA